MSGGLLPFPDLSSQAQADLVDAGFARRFAQAPVASSIVLAPDTPPQAVTDLQLALRAADPATSTEVPARPAPLELRVPRDRGIAQQDIPEHFPSIWLGAAYRIIYPDMELHAYDNEFVYESPFDADPDLFTEDWGMEIGMATFNSSLGGTRPICTGGDAELDFWSGTYNLGGLWGADVPAASHPYPDFQIVSDDCSTNSVEIGIGFPRELAQDTPYLAFVELVPGNLALSPASAAVRMISNDCNDIRLDPHTNCMGLNSGRTPPLESPQNYVNRDRGWFVPACALMADGLHAPILVESGTDECPDEVFVV